MAVLYSNNASTTLSASITDSATSLTVAAGKGALFPAISGSDYFYITLVAASGVIEIMKVTARSADVFTVTRGQDGTTAVAWGAGDRVELRFNKALLDDVKSALVSAVTSADWNVANPNVAQLISTSTNGVNGVTNYVGMHFPHASLNYGFQIAGRNDSAYYRTLENNTYTAWRAIAHSATQLYTFPVLDNNLNLDSGQQDKVWATNIGTATDRGTKPTNYAFVVNLGGRAASGLQIAASYGGSDNFYVRRGSDNGGSVNGANAWQPWYTLLHSGNYSSYAAAASHTHSYLPLSGGTVNGMVKVVSTGGFNGDTGDGSVNFLARLNSDSTFLGAINQYGYQAFAVNILGSQDSASSRGYVSFYTKTDGSWKEALRLNDGTVNAVNTLTQGGNQVLHAGNFSSYALPNPGSGTGGRVLVNLSGNPSWSDASFTYDPIMGQFRATNFRANVGDAAPTWNFNAILHAGNYTSYSPSLTGSGASGTWGINVSGSAATASNTSNAWQLGTDIGSKDSALQYWQAHSNTTLNPNSDWHYALRMSHGDAETYYSATIALAFGDDVLSFRRKVNGTNQTWRTVLHSGNYTNYGDGRYVLKTGDTMTGTLQVNSLSNSVIAQHDGTGAYWRGRIISRNSDANRAVFLGNYNSKAGLFAHTNALDGWAPLYLNTLGDNGGSTVYLPHNATYTLDSANNAYAILNAGNYTGFSGYLRAGGGNDGMDFNTLAYNTMYYAYINASPNRPGSYGYSYGTILTFDPGQGAGGRAQFYVSHAGNDLIFRGGWSGNDSWQAWNRVLTDQNYTSYTGQYVLKSGDTMTGTLKINTSGSGSGTSHFIIKRSGAAEPSSFGSYAGLWRSSIEVWNNDTTKMLFLNPAETDFNFAHIKSVNGGLVLDVGSNGGTRAFTVATNGTVYFDQGESANVYGVRGRYTNEYIHLYNKVGVGHPSGWGMGEGNTPDKGFSTYGGINIAYGTGDQSTFNGSVLVGANGLGLAYTGASSGKLYFGSSGSDAPSSYHIGTAMEDYGGNYSKLDIKWYTGQRFYAHHGYAGFRFKEITTGATLFSVGETDLNVRVSNTLYIGGNVALHAGNYTNYNFDSRYVLKSGDTMTGGLVAPGVDTNYADSAGWASGTASATGYFGGPFIVNGSDSENTRLFTDTPFFSPGLIWAATNNDAASDGDGGWDKLITGLSHTKTYRSVVWVRRTTSSTNGQFYHGCDAGGATLNLNGTTNYNPYFSSFGIVNLVQGRWYLSVGYIHAYGDGSTSSYGGLWDTVTGTRVINYTDYKMAYLATQQVHRTYLYYSTDSAARLEWWAPRFEEVDGNEPSINSMLLGATTVLTVNNYSNHVLPLSGGVVNGTGYFRKNQTAGDYTTAALWTESYGNTSTGIAFHISGVAGRYLEMRNNSANLFWNGSVILNDGNYSSYALPLIGGTLTGSLVNNQDGGVIVESNASENNNWLFKEASKAWGIFYFNKGSQSGQTIGGYTTVGAETMFMGAGSGYAMPSGWTGYASGSYVAAMISHYTGYIYSASTVYAASSMSVGGSTVLHAGNYSSYALPLSGGVITGNTSLQGASGISLDFYNTTTPSTTSVQNRWLGGSSFIGKNSSGTYHTLGNRFAREISYTNGATFGAVVDEAYVSNVLNIYTQLYQDSWGIYSSYATGSLARHFAVLGGSIGPGSSSYDNTMSAGTSTARYTIVYATTGTINTSDVNEKEQIQDLDAAELRVAMAIKGLIKRFKWKEAVVKKGADARIHVGVIAQEVEQAFIAEGLNPAQYALFCEDVWWEKMVPNQNYGRPECPNEPQTILETFEVEVEGGVRKERKGIRYDQLLAFVIAAI